MKLLKDYPEISFRILDKQHNMLPGIRYAFLKEEVFDLETDSLLERKKDGFYYSIFWDFSAGEPSVPANIKTFPIVASYREQNGQRIVVIRPSAKASMTNSSKEQ